MKGNTFHGLGEKLPFWHFDDDVMVYADGSLGVGFELSGMDIAAASTSQVNEFTSALENLINTAQEEVRLQVFYRLTPYVSELIEAHEKLTGNPSDSYSPLVSSRVSFLNKNVENGHYFKPEVYFFVRSAPSKYRKQRFWQSEVSFQQLTEKEYQEHKDSFLRVVKQVESSLSHARLNPVQLAKEKWFQLLYEYLNLSRSEQFKCPKLRDRDPLNPFEAPFTEQVCLTDLEVHKDHLKVGNLFFRVITLKTLPEGQSNAAMMERFLKLPFYFWFSQSITVHDQKREIEKLQLQRRLTHSMASGAGNVSDLESESKLGHIEELIREILEGSEKIVSTDLSCVIWAKSVDELEEKSDEVLKAFRGLNQSEGIVETLPSFDAFLKSVPGGCSGLRTKKVKTSNAAHLMPVFSSWLGNKRPVCVFPNRDGVPISVDPFASELPAWNGIFFGSTGSGKSMSVLQLILMFYGQTPRPKVVWIDNGASSQRAIEVLGGEFIDANLHSGIKLNAFDLEEGETKPTPTKVKLILAVLETILKDDEKVGLPKREKALLEEAIFQCYGRVQGCVPYLSDLRNLLKEHPNAELKSYSEILYSWTGDTAYGRILDGPSNVTLTKNLTTVEIKGLDTAPELQSVLLLLFTEFIRTQAAKDVSQPFLLIIDEGWKIFQTGFSFALEAYRTFRKYRSAIWILSQNAFDFLSNEEIARAVLPNTTHIGILKQRGIDWDNFKKVLGLNDTELEIVKSLQMVKGKYTEIFYMQDENRTVLRLAPDPLSYWICTSDPQDKATIERVEKENPNLSKIEVLQKIVKTQEEALSA